MPIRSFPRRPAIILIAVAALLIASCGGSKRKPTYPTQGKLLVNGQPAAGVTVFLHSLDATETEPTRPFATTKPDGTFSLTTTAADDGAPAGEYVVTLLYEPLESPLMRANKGKPPTFDKKYGDPKASPLRVTIQAKPSNELPPLEVK